MTRIYAPGQPVQITDTAAQSQPPPPPPPTGATIVKLGLIFAAVGMMPFAVGHPFKRGDVPQGAVVIADCAQFQFVPWSYFDDNSVRFARVAGYCNVTAPGRVDVSLQLGTPSAVPAFVRTAMPDVQITINGTRIAPSVKKVVAAGPVMVHEQWVCKLDQQVAVTYETMSFSGGQTCVTAPRAENMGFLASTQPNRVLALKAVIGGAMTFSESVDVKHHSIATMMRGAQWSYWIGGDPTVLPEYDHAYVCACESWPPFSAASNAVLGNFAQSYGPNYIGEDGTAMGGTGYGPHIGICSRSSIFPLTLGTRKAWNYMMTEALSAGSWSWHLRDEATGDVPRFRQYPTYSRQTNIPLGSGPQNGNHDIAHHPSLSYVAAVLTGRQDLIDEVLQLAASNHFQQHASLRGNDKGWLRTDVGMNQVRGGGWALRTLAQAVAICPANHPLLPDLVYAWQENMAWYRARYVDGTLDGGKWVNNLGALGTYTSDGKSPYNNPVDIGASTAYWDAEWMQAIVTQSIGVALYMHLPTQQADTQAVFMQGAKMIVGACGDGTTSWNWRRFGVYAMPFGPVGTSIPPNSGWYADLGKAYAHYIAIKGLQALDPALGGTIKQHSRESDVTAQDWTTGFLSYEFPALVFAKLHGAPGADLAWARVTSSASWPLIAAGVHEPEWAGMMPPGIKHPGTV